jgi:hypothetical protein
MLSRSETHARLGTAWLLFALTRRHGQEALKIEEFKAWTALVRAGNSRKRRANPRKGRFYQTDAKQDRALSEALRRPKPPPKVERLSFRYVYARLLHQSRGEGIVRDAKAET